VPAAERGIAQTREWLRAYQAEHPSPRVALDQLASRKAGDTPNQGWRWARRLRMKVSGRVNPARGTSEWIFVPGKPLSRSAVASHRVLVSPGAVRLAGATELTQVVRRLFRQVHSITAEPSKVRRFPVGAPDSLVSIWAHR
jgi:hypothetical protein